MIEFLLRNLAVGLIGLLAVLIARRQSASVRHAMVAIALLGTILVPMAGVLLPQHVMRVLPATEAVSQVTATKPGPFSSPAPIVHPAMTPIGVDEAPQSTPWLPLAWAFGSLLLLARMLFGIATIETWRRSGVPTPNGCGREEALVVPKIQIPMTAWLGRHYIFLPEDWQTWSADRQDSVLAHERAHIQRGDWFLQVAGQLLCAALWFNPVQWLLNRELRQLSELAADDLALASGVVPSRYADDLLEIARKTTKGVPSMALAMAAKPHISRRIRMILNPNVSRRPIGRAGMAGLLAALILVSAPLCAIAIGPAEGVRAQKPVGSPTQVDVDMAIVKPDAEINLPNMRRLQLPEKQPTAIINFDRFFETLNGLSKRKLATQVIASKSPHATVTKGSCVLFGRTYHFTINAFANAKSSPDHHQPLTVQVAFGDGDGEPKQVTYAQTKSGQGLLLAMRSPSHPSSTIGLMLRPHVVWPASDAEARKDAEAARPGAKKVVNIKVTLLDRYTDNSPGAKPLRAPEGSPRTQSYRVQFFMGGSEQVIRAGLGDYHVASVSTLHVRAGEEGALKLDPSGNLSEIRILPTLKSDGSINLDYRFGLNGMPPQRSGGAASPPGGGWCVEFPESKLPGAIRAVLLEATLANAEIMQQAR